MCTVVAEQAGQSSVPINSTKDFLIFSMGWQKLGEGTYGGSYSEKKKKNTNFGDKTWNLTPIVFNASNRPGGKSSLGHSFPILFCI